MSRGLWSTTGLGKGAFLDAVAHVVPPKIDRSPAADRPAAGHDQDLLIGPHVVQDLIDCPQAPLGRRRRYTDRKRVVEGKSVHVRVDLGGGRLLTTKNDCTTNYTLGAYVTRKTNT